MDVLLVKSPRSLVHTLCRRSGGPRPQVVGVGTLEDPDNKHTPRTRPSDLRRDGTAVRGPGPDQVVWRDTNLTDEQHGPRHDPGRSNVPTPSVNWTDPESEE